MAIRVRDALRESSPRRSRALAMICSTSFPEPLESPCSAADRVNRVVTASPRTTYDAELVRRCHTGDDAAFAEIVTRYRGKMYAIALSMLRNHADAEEVAQDTFVRAYRGLARFRGDSSLASWLHCIAANLARNRYWYFFRRRRHSTQSLDCAVSANSTMTYADLVASDAPGPVREATTREFLALVAECMAKLPASQREVLLLRNVRLCSYRDIAGMFGISIGTVKSRIGRARESLRGLLAETYAELEPGTAPSFQWFESNRSTRSSAPARWNATVDSLRIPAGDASRR